MSRPWTRPLPAAATTFGLLAVWQAVVGLGLVDFEYLPTPVEIVGGGRDVIQDGALADALGHTLLMVLASWALACAVGVVCGLLVGLVSTVRTLSSTTIELLRPLPAIGFIPVLVVLFGLSNWVEVLAGAYAALWPVLVNTAGAVRTVDPTLLEVSRVFDLSRLRTGTRVVLPAIAPSVLVGMSLALGVALVVVVAVEMVGVPRGLGYQIVAAQQSLHPDQMFFYVGVTALLGVALNAGVTRAGALLLPGAPALTRRGEA